MDARFTRAYNTISERRDSGEPLVRILRSISTRQLIAALAGAPLGEDELLANVVATELLNRQRRAPFLVVFLVNISLLITTFIFDALLLDSSLLVLTTVETRVIAVASAVFAALSGIAFLLWRGKFPRVQALMTRPRHRY